MGNRELYGFLETFTGDHYDDLTPDLSLTRDLGIYGEEAEEFIRGFADKFKVDISSFNFSDHFENEGDRISKFIVSVFRQNIPKKDLRISDLKNAIQSGKLV